MLSCRANEIFSALLPMTIAHTVTNTPHRPKSGQSLPVLRQDRLAGILYAENRAMTSKASPPRPSATNPATTRSSKSSG